MNKWLVAFVVAIVVKFFLGLVTPLSWDFVYWLTVANGSLSQIAATGFYAPWALFMKAITETWGVLPIVHPHLEDAIGFWYFRPSPSITLLIAMQKAPLLALDAATALTIKTVVDHYRAPPFGNHAMILWLANPYVTLTTEMWGIWDIASTFFLLLACVWFSRGQYFRSGLLLGIAIVAKLYPILALPVFLVFLLRKNLGQNISSFSIGLVISLSAFIPVLLAEKPAVSTSLIQQFSVNLQYLLGYSIDLYGVGISLTVAALSLFILGCHLAWKSDASLFEAVLCLYLIVIAFSYWQPQFLLHLIPFLTIFYVSSGSRKLPFLAYMSAALLYVLVAWAFYWTSWGHTLFFIPNYNSLMEHYSQLYLFIPGWPIGAGATLNTLLASPARSVLVAASVWYLIWMFARNMDRNLLRNLISYVGRSSFRSSRVGYNAGNRRNMDHVVVDTDLDERQLASWCENNRSDV